VDRGSSTRLRKWSCGFLPGRRLSGRSSGLRSIRFFNDWYHPWPLWENSTAYPEDFGLSVELGNALHDWHRVWEDSVDPFTGWRSHADRTAWEADGEVLLEQLVREVWDIAQVDPARRLWRS
jgi:hypothetical protein